jgi:tetratricopeptide (TPR) repeat protein
MPRAKTNVTHAALHHHRIGIHDQGGDLQQADDSGLKPVLDISSLPQRERERCLALAKIGFIRNEPHRSQSKQFEIEATRALIQLMNTGNLDPLAVSQMAWLARKQGERAIAEKFASDVLKMERRPTLARIEATEILAEIAFEKQKMRQAADLFRQANGYYRNSRNAFYLGVCLNNLGDVDNAVTTLEDLLEFDPSQTSAHAALQAIYQVTKQPQKAAYHEQRLLKLTALLQMLDSR